MTYWRKVWPWVVRASVALLLLIYVVGVAFWIGFLCDLWIPIAREWGW